MNRQESRTAREALRQGFTLIEILVARVATTRSLIKSVDDALVTYNSKHGGKYPDTLDVLTQETDDADAILQGGIEDPWGNELKYEKRGKKRPLLTSAGPDGEFGTDDDITNLDKDKIKK